MSKISLLQFLSLINQSPAIELNVFLVVLAILELHTSNETYRNSLVLWFLFTSCVIHVTLAGAAAYSSGGKGKPSSATND